mmetsp:Transcript_67464/g.150579  ORF Transcript_67464/g.150579 Transcript_67464/m.150579 type:complete len:134 (-) Transcript_67464:221-622(-)
MRTQLHPQSLSSLTKVWRCVLVMGCLPGDGLLAAGAHTTAKTCEPLLVTGEWHECALCWRERLTQRALSDLLSDGSTIVCYCCEGRRRGQHGGRTLRLILNNWRYICGVCYTEVDRLAALSEKCGSEYAGSGM